MQIRDSEVIRLIERIGDHYKSNIANRHIRPALLHLPLDNQAWDLLEILTEKSDQYRYQGFHLDELYQQLIAAARFVALARRDLVPSLRNRLNSVSKISDADRVLRDMAVNNFPSNLTIFADLLNELYIKLVEIDREAAKGRPPLYTQITELQDLGKLLVN
ncbi:MAG: hypothetical protein SNJ56_04665 [Termitinemataceae bacterium]